LSYSKDLLIEGKVEDFVYRPEEIPEAFTRMKAQAFSLLKL
jgi:uncharacterized protein (DUF1786 family)